MPKYQGFKEEFLVTICFFELFTVDTIQAYPKFQ